MRTISGPISASPGGLDGLRSNGLLGLGPSVQHSLSRALALRRAQCTYRLKHTITHRNTAMLAPDAMLAVSSMTCFRDAEDEKRENTELKFLSKKREKS